VPESGSPYLLAATDGITGVEPLRTDGTVAGTYLLQDLAEGPGSSQSAVAIEAGGLLYLVVNDGQHGAELWTIPVSGL
jgi:ELWxxDGT repeat protein